MRYYPLSSTCSFTVADLLPSSQNVVSRTDSLKKVMIAWNTMDYNGIAWNDQNGIAWNGIAWNTMDWNGIAGGKYNEK
eukprot:scaffold1900_cov183-Ochromonas_danica.AAC.7